jgi:hypothetical protein
MSKKIVLGLLATIVTMSGAAAASVNALPRQTDITGVITDNHVAVADAHVTVTCMGNVQTDVTDDHGSYLVTFGGAECPFGETVKVAAQKDGRSGVSSGTVMGITTKLNLAIVNVSIPEYGLIGAIMAGGAGIGLIAYTRRRQQEEFQF